MSSNGHRQVTVLITTLVMLALSTLGTAARAGEPAGATLPDTLSAGDTLTFTYVPGKGTSLQTGDQELGVFEGKGFADAVFSIWLGPKPPSDDLKQGTLG